MIKMIIYTSICNEYDMIMKDILIKTISRVRYWNHDLSSAQCTK